MLLAEEKVKYLKLIDHQGPLQSAFLQAQRLIWEKSIFPSRFPPCSTFMCANCHGKPRNLCICLSCGNIFCPEHFQEHPCKNPLGIDIQTQQLFVFNPEHGRMFIFDALLDRLIISAKLAVVDGIPFSSNLDPGMPILPSHRVPIALQNICNTCWLNSILQCLMANPLVEKWFLSGKYQLSEIDSPIATVHVMFKKMFLCLNGKGNFSISEFLFCLKTLYPELNLSEQLDAQEFFLRIRTSLDDFYQAKFESKEFGNIFNWTFNVIESCEYCSFTQAHPSPESILTLPYAASNSLSEAIDHFFNGESPMKCQQCEHTSKKQYYFHSLPQTLTISLVRTSSDNRGVSNLKIEETLELNKYIDPDMKKYIDSSKYSLVAAVVRPKTGDLGHFWADVKRNGMWFQCNDNQVKQTTLDDVIHDDLILLFYLRNGFISRK